MRVTIDNERAELTTYWELPESRRQEFDYIEHYVDDNEPRFFYAWGAWWDANEFTLAPSNLRAAGWDGYMADTFFSGLAITFLEGDDDGFVRVGRVLA